MAADIHGRLGAVDLSATTLTAVYTCPASRKATGNLSICNRNATAITYRVAHIDGAVGDIANADYLRYGKTLGAYDDVEFTKIPLTAAGTVAVYSDTANVSCVFQGIEEDV